MVTIVMNSDPLLDELDFAYVCAWLAEGIWLLSK